MATDHSARFVLATDWSSPGHVVAALRAYALLGRSARFTAVVAVPGDPGDVDETRVRRVLGAIPVDIAGGLTVESFSEVVQQPYEAAIVPQGDVSSLAVQVADWVTALAVTGSSSGLPMNQGSPQDLRERLANFHEQVTPPMAVAAGPTWYGTYVGGGRVLAALRTGGRVYLPADNRATTPNVMQSGVFEPELHAFISTHVPTGGLAIDVGANIGILTVALARTVSQPGRVIALEPVPANLEFIRWNVETNWLMDIVTVVDAAASDSVGTTAMRVSDEWNSLGSITQESIDFSPGHIAAAQHELQVRTVRLDDLLKGEGQVDFVKIDVEGAEHLVFAGMSELLEHQAIDRIAFECMREHMGDAWGGFMNTLKSLEDKGWTFAVPRIDGDVSGLPVAAIEAAESFRCLVMEKPGLRAPVTAHRI